MLGVWAWLTSRVGRIAASIGGVLLAALYLFKRGERKGAKKLKNKVNSQTVDAVLKTVKKEKEIDEEVKSASATERRNRLREYATSDSNTE